MLNSGLSSVTGVYTVEDAGGINVGGYTATLKLEDSANHKWSSGDTDGDGIIVLAYSIKKAKVSIYEEKVNIAGWTYNSYNANVNVLSGITYDKTFAGITVQYQYSTDNGNTWTAWGNPATYNAGNYQVRAIVVGTANYDGDETAAGSFTISKASATINGSTTYSAAYSGNPYTISGLTASYNGAPAFQYAYTKWNATTEKYDISVNSIVDAGTYQVVVTLPESTNYNGASLTATVTITKANTSITSFTINGWTYGNYVAPTVTATPSTAVVKIYYSADGGTTWSETVPTQVGNYQAQAVIAGTTNYSGAESVVKSFSIGRATPTWSDIFTGNKFYQSLLGDEVKKLVAKNGSTTVDGTFTFTSSFSATAGASTITVTFTPDNQTNYAPTTVPYNITLVAVAMLNNVSYGTFESALKVANDAGSGTVLALPYDKDLAAKNQYPTIIGENVNGNMELTIRSGVTLLLPYASADGTTGQNTYTDGLIDVTMHYDNSCANHGASYNITDDNAFCRDYCFVKVIIADGVTIHNRGTLEIAGQLSGGAGSNKFAGYTAGLHARLILGSGATITSYDNSIIRAAGYIRNLDEADGGQVIIQSGAKLYQPFVMMDYYSGQYLAGPYKTLLDGKGNPVNPFNKFTMINVSPTVRVNYGGTVIGWAALFTTSTDGNNTTSLTYVGTGGVVELLEGSYLTAKLNPDLNSLVTKLDIYGGAKTNPIQMKITLFEKLSISLDLDVNTEKCWFPLTYLHDITLHNGNYTIGQNFKMMPGAKLTVAADATLNITGKFIVYDQDEDAISSPALEFSYYDDQRPNHPARDNVQYGVTDPAVFTVNGAVTAATFGGKVKSDNPGAIIVINTATYLEAHEAKTYKEGDLKGLGYDSLIGLAESIIGVGTCQEVDERYYIKKNAVLVNNDGSIVNPSLTTTYAYANGVWKQPVVHINFNANGGIGVSSIGVPFDDGIYQSLPTPTREHYTFVGWKDGNGNLITNGTDLPADCVAGSTLTLTAEWELTEYTLQYQGVDKDGNPIAWTMDSIKFKLGGSYSLPTITPPTGYTHIGWKFGGKAITSLTIEECLAAVKETDDGVITVQVVFESNDNTYTYIFNLGNAYSGLGYSNQSWSLGTYPNSTEHPELMKQLIGDGVNYETSPLHQFYFEGWYTDAEFTRVYDKTYQPTDEEKQNKTITLYAKWSEKVSIKYTASDQSIYTGLITNGDTLLAYGTTYWFKPDSIVLANVKENDSNTGLQYYFKSWTLNGEAFDESNAGKSYSQLKKGQDNVIHITWGTKGTVKVTYYDGNILIGDISVGIKTGNSKGTGTYYLKPGNVVIKYQEWAETFEVIFTYSTNNQDPGASGTSVEELSENTKDSNNRVWSCTINLTENSVYWFYADSNPEADTCITADTLVTLADGTQKRADELTYDDELLVWDFYSGCYTSAPISILVAHEECVQAVLYLYFSDGTTAKVIQNHGFFDTSVNNFVYIGADNVDEFIGHSFIKANADTCGEVTLIGYEVIEELNTAYWVQTAVHNNAITDGMLTIVTPDYEGWFDYFNITDDMKYDEEHMSSEIEKYGLFTYEDLAEFGTYEQFVALNGQYMKILIGRGVVTMEEILALLETYG